MNRALCLVVVFLGVTAAQAQPSNQVFYMSPTGSDANNGLSEAAPFKTFLKAFSTMQGGDELVLRDGTYSEAAGTGIIHWQGANAAQITSGVDLARQTYVHAKNPGAVILAGQLFIGRSFRKDRYITIRGITFEGGGMIYNGDYVTIKECGFHDVSNGGGSVFGIGTNDHNDGNRYNLIEDCWIWGRNRIIASNYRADRNVWRRVVIRGDGCNSADCAGSGNPNVGVTVYNSSDVSMQNVVVIDRILDGGSPYGSFATAQHQDWGDGAGEWQGPNEWLGTISLNGEDGGYVFEADDANDNTLHMENIVAWKNGGGLNIGTASWSTNKTRNIHVSNATLGENGDHDGLRVAPEVPPPGIVRNVIVYKASRGVNSSVQPGYCDVDGATVSDYNQTACATGCRTSNPTADGAIPSLKYITRIEAGSALKGTGFGGADYGANVLYRYGVDGSRYGDTNYNTLTASPLWPWPYEDRIKAQLAQDSTRGFCATNTTLTRYIWEYLGHPIPTTIYGGASTGTVFYVDDDAPDNSGDGLTPATAMHNLSAALALCNTNGGDTVTLLDGVYDEAADRIQHSVLPKTPTNYTTIKALNRWGVDMRQPLDCSVDNAVRNYVELDGLRFTSLGNHTFAGARWKIRNCAFHGRLGMGNNGSSLPGLACEYNLVEDCHVWGPGATNSMRYKVQVYNSRNIIVRCVVARHDGQYWSVGVQNPSAVFVVYSCQNVMLQNCIAIDSPGPDCDEWSAGYYTADHRGNNQLLWSNVAWQGCIAAQITGTYAFRIDNGQDAGATDRYDNCVVIGGQGPTAFVAWNNYSVSSRLEYTQCSVVNTGNVRYATGFSEGGYVSSARRCVVRGVSGSAIGTINTTQYNNAFACGSNNPGNNGFTTDPETNGLLYPIRIEPGSLLQTAGGGSRVGADLSKAWGVSGSFWGDPGYDAPTTNNLWPFPNEAQIQSDFRAFDNTSDEWRGFCAPGMTLTRYLWEYLGRPADSDDDRLPDWWEWLYFGSATGAVASTDNDADGHTAGQEYVAGTDPTNVNSVFEFASVGCVTAGATITWPSVSNRVYSISRGTNLSDSAFAPLNTNLVATPPVNVYTDTVQSAGPWFYRIRVR
ncbi:MAG: hypothetical protein V1929_12285 [bacterium]